ncbi:unnamed protein product [Effrenium voratum]|nr:unnamed protein product [Effrenium voratum]
MHSRLLTKKTRKTTVLSFGTLNALRQSILAKVKETVREPELPRKVEELMSASTKEAKQDLDAHMQDVVDKRRQEGKKKPELTGKKKKAKKDSTDSSENSDPEDGSDLDSDNAESEGAPSMPSTAAPSKSTRKRGDSSKLSVAAKSVSAIPADDFDLFSNPRFSPKSSEKVHGWQPSEPFSAALPEEAKNTSAAVDASKENTPCPVSLELQEMLSSVTQENFQREEALVWMESNPSGNPAKFLTKGILGTSMFNKMPFSSKMESYLGILEVLDQCSSQVEGFVCMKQWLRTLVPVADMFWFVLRLPAEELLAQDIAAARVQKRLMHTLAQQLELGMAECKIPLLSKPPSVHQETPCQTPWSSGDRAGNAQLVKQELAKRFLSRSGFVSGSHSAANADRLSDVSIKLPGLSDRSNGAVAASQLATSYFARASLSLLQKMASQTYKHLAIYYDASHVFTYEVLQIHISVDGAVLCAPLSVMPQLKVPAETSVATNLETAAKLAKAKSKAAAQRLCREEKTSSRQTLMSLNHSLFALARIRLSDASPACVLRPPKKSEKRCYFEEDGRRLPFLWDSDTKDAEWQHTSYPAFSNHIRISTLQDHGDVTAAYQLADHGVAIMIHQDTQHKLHREECLSRADVPEIDLCIKQCMLIMKYDKAPWATSAFGRRMQEAMARIDEIPADHVLVQMVATGVIRDHGMDPRSTLEDVKNTLRLYAVNGYGRTGGDHKLGRWCDFVDSFGKLKRIWHCRLFMFLFAHMLEGKNPWEAVAGSNASGEDETSISCRVLRVLVRPSALALATSAYICLSPFRSFQATEVKDDKSPGGSHRIQRYVALHWHSLCLRTWQNALSSQNLRELCSGLADAEEISAVLSSHFKFLTATLRRFLEFGLLYRHYPWRFFCLCDESPQVAQDTMADMKAEWQLLMKLEAVPGASATWPLKSVPIVRWQVYREVMTFAEERHWQVTKDLTDLISAWCADPSSTLGCEEVFRHLRLAERRHTSSSICVPQIQAVAIKGLNERYQKFETQPLEAEAISSVPVGSVIKPGIWSAERDSASDTGICRFNQLARSTVVSPHYLQRRSLNIWSTLKTQGDLTDSWTSELVRPGQVITDGSEIHLVIDAPYVHLKVWPLRAIQIPSGNGQCDAAEIPTSSWDLKEMVVKKPSDCLVIDTAPEMLEEHGEAKLVLKLGARLALPNYALENYASRLSADALKNLAKACGCETRGHMSKRLRASLLLKHLNYPDAQIEAILSTFTVQKKKRLRERARTDRTTRTTPTLTESNRRSWWTASARLSSSTSCSSRWSPKTRKSRSSRLSRSLELATCGRHGRKPTGPLSAPLPALACLARALLRSAGLRRPAHLCKAFCQQATRGWARARSLEAFALRALAPAAAVQHVARAAWLWSWSDSKATKG